MANLIKRILVLNSGSSSLKYALYKIRDNMVNVACASGIVEKIGERSQTVKHTQLDDADTKVTVKEERNSLSSHEEALDHVLNLMSLANKSSSESDLLAVGHRVVHGGEGLTSAHLVDDEVIAKIENASVLAPLHNPSNLCGIKVAMKIFDKQVKQVAVFDTAFHSNIPKCTYLYGLPYEYYTNFGIRKYGFHGTSHNYIMNEASRFLQLPIEEVNLITCHLGAGASISCIKGGVCVDSSMGMTPTSGLLMQTRCGDLDSGVIFYLMKQLKISPDEMERILNKESGWFGISGCKNAMDLERLFVSKNSRAEDAVQCMVHRIKSYLGSFYWILGGNVNAITFSGGVGENWPLLRELCLEGVVSLGFDIDILKNDSTKSVSSPVNVSTSQSKSKILVIPTNEEYSIANITLDTINKKL